MRMFDPDDGQVLIDDMDIREASLKTLGVEIGLVVQHTLLSNSAVWMKITYVRSMASQQEIEQAGRATS